MRRKVKFWLLFLLGVCIFTPFFLLSIMIQVMNGISFYGILFSISVLLSFFLYCYSLYVSTTKEKTPKYPIVPPEGRTDIYFPRTNIPRPIHEDVRRYPNFFKTHKKRKFKKSQRNEKEKRKK